MTRAHADASKSYTIVIRILICIHIDIFEVNSESIHGHSIQKWRPKFQNSHFTSMRNDYPAYSRLGFIQR